VDTRHPEAVARAERSWSMNRIDEAQATLREVLASDPDDFGARYRLGILELETDPARAVAELELAAAERPRHPGPPFFLARARFQMDEEGAWEDDLATAVALSRARSGFALAETTEAVAAALTAFRAQQFDMAAPALREAAEAAGEDPGLWYLAGWAALETRSVLWARGAAERALEIDSVFPEALVLLARARWAQGDRPGTRAALEEALAIDPDLSIAHTHLGILLLDRTDFRDGILELWRAILIDPVDPLPHRELGQAFFSMRMGPQGIPYLERGDWLTTFLRRSPTPGSSSPR
jgi:tetratricopeptide (TPR) repeat protein